MHKQVKKRDIAHFLVHFPNIHSTWDGAGPKLEVRNPGVPCGVASTEALEPLPLCHRVCRKLDSEPGVGN